MRRFLILYFLAIALTAGQNTPARAMGSRPPEPEHFAPAPPDPVSKKPLTLEKAYELALKRSEDLAIARVDINQTWADFLEASGTAIGDMDFQMLQFLQKDTDASSATGATSTSQKPLRRTRQFTYSQPLFQGFKSYAALKSAGSLRTREIELKRRAEQLLYRDVAESFYTVLRLQEDTGITRNTLKLLNERVEKLEEWEKIGKSRLSEISTAKARMRRIEADLAQENGRMAVERRTLEFLTGIALEHALLEDTHQDLPAQAEAVDQYLQSSQTRPDVIAANEDLKLARQNIIASQSDLWPEITLDTNLYEKREGFQAGIDWDLLFKINVPIFKGGETLAEVKRAAGEKQKSELTAQKTVRMAETEVRQAYDAWNSSLNEYKALDASVKAAEENYNFQLQDYEKKLVDNLDVLAALEALNDDRLEANRSFFETKINLILLQTAAGTCCEPIGTDD